MTAAKNSIDTAPLLGGGTGGNEKIRNQTRITLTSKRRKMSRRANLIGICGVCSLCILLLIATTQHRPLLTASLISSNTAAATSGRSRMMHTLKTGASTELTDERSSYGNRNNLPANNFEKQNNYNVTATIDDVVAAQRQRILNEMKNYAYDAEETNIKKLSDLTTETNGQPIRSIIITTWRSGSTFLGDILNAMPANYYHYEPLLDFGIVRLRSMPEGKEAIENLINLLKCDYAPLQNYLDYGKTHTNLFEHNERLWKVCQYFPNYCWEPKFLTPFCKLFPLQSMKTVRVSLELSEQLLLEESLNVRLILLVRDPRGTMQSRKHRSWCAGSPDCEEPQVLCNDLVEDYNNAKKLLNKYPTRLKVVRYEDLSLSPYEMSQEILQFYGLPFDPMVEEFLNTHTKVNIGGVSSTFRDSKSAPFHWKQDLRIEEIKFIQKECSEAMELWGYRRIENFTNFQTAFDPLILPPPFV